MRSRKYFGLSLWYLGRCALWSCISLQLFKLRKSECINLTGFCFCIFLISGWLNEPLFPLLTVDSYAHINNVRQSIPIVCLFSCHLNILINIWKQRLLTILITYLETELESNELCSKFTLYDMSLTLLCSLQNHKLLFCSVEKQSKNL